ncbi:MAG TPA: inositol monophosphatase [Candidatus Limnocylindria bacterium]
MDDAEALDLATRAAFRGGQLAVARLGDPGYLRWKGQRDVVAGATYEVQGQIVSALQEEAPADAILAEEGDEDEPLAVDARRLWIVDPICGSLNFVRGVPFFGISIALRVDGELRVGVVHDPVRGETFAARYGEPATLDGRMINVRPVPLGPEFWEQAWVGTDLPPSGPRRRQALRVFDVMADEVLSLSVLGSPALGLCYVAAGRLHGYWTLDAKPWDVAAAILIVQQAGGLVTDADGGSWLHSDGSFVAANPTSHQWQLKSIKWIRDLDRQAQEREGGGPQAAASR